MKRTGSLNFKMSHGGCGTFVLEESGNEEILLCFPDGKDQWCTRYNRRSFINFEYYVTYPTRFCYINSILNLFLRSSVQSLKNYVAKNHTLILFDAKFAQKYNICLPMFGYYVIGLLYIIPIYYVIARCHGHN